jgi:TPR repeat protein
VDHAKAFQYYGLAAAQGMASAQFNLAISYLKGEGVRQDQAKAVEWLKKAADQNYAEAVAALKDLGQGGQQQ